MSEPSKNLGGVALTTYDCHCGRRFVTMETRKKHQRRCKVRA